MEWHIYNTERKKKKQTLILYSVKISLKKYGKNLWFQLIHVKSFGNSPFHCYNKENLNKLNVTDFSWMPHWTEIIEHTTTPKSRETDKSRDLQLRSAYLEKKPLEP